MSQSLLAAALLGVGYSEALNKLRMRLTRSVKLRIVVVGSLVSALIVLGAGWAISGHVNLSLWSLLPGMLGLAIILVCVFFRLR
jgi:hypothetical protein